MEESPIAILSPPSHPIATEKQEAVLHIVGTAKLAGHVPISGAKNSALALMAGALLSSEGCTIANLPCLVDVQRMEEILVSLGVRVQREDGRIHLDTSCLSSAQAPYELVSQMRASFFIIGPSPVPFGHSPDSSAGWLCYRRTPSGSTRQGVAGNGCRGGN